MRVASGDGLIARFGDVVAYAGVNEEPAAALLAAVDSAARVRQPGPILAGQLAPIAFGVARTVPFGLVAPTAEGLCVLLHGPVHADIETQDGKQGLDGQDAPIWASRVPPEPVLKVGVGGCRRSSVPATPRTDLKAGVVPGGGFVLVRTGARVDSGRRPRIAVPERKPSTVESIDTVHITRRAAPVETSVVQATVGALATDDGADYPLDRAYVIGRAPLSDDAVRDAKASPIVVPSDPYVSRVHAYVTVDRGGVFVRDAGTAAGTFIAAPGAEQWTQIDTSPTKLEPGWSLRVGEWVVTYRGADQQ